METKENVRSPVSYAVRPRAEHLAEIHTIHFIDKKEVSDGAPVAPSFSNFPQCTILR